MQINKSTSPEHRSTVGNDDDMMILSIFSYIFKGLQSI